ncbi:MAG: hypothetical protein HY904_03775 [Deltaproteobacteria bacterium]|nr:hypothetical protein [Deltaproteobacteria bacterium]
MTPLMPGRLGHYAVRTRPAVVGNTARWPQDFHPRGLIPLEDRLARPHPLPMPPHAVVALGVVPRGAPATTFANLFNLHPVN